MSAILRIGNIAFVRDKGDGVVLQPSAKTHLAVACRLLGIEGKEDNLVEGMTVKYLTIPGQKEPIATKMNEFEASSCRNSLARDLYGRAFTFIVDFLNSKMVSTELDPSLKQEQLHWIGMLDIFGFEVGERQIPIRSNRQQYTNKIIK